MNHASDDSPDIIKKSISPQAIMKMIMLISMMMVMMIVMCTHPVAAAAGALPVVLWHGMGDWGESDSMGYVKHVIQTQLPGTYVYSVQLGTSETEDRDNGIFGIINQQLEKVCETLRLDSQLSNGFNAIGFSQGGLFLRAYVERCNAPHVNNLITFGSPHMGIADAPNCRNSTDLNCVVMRRLIKSGSYLSWVQNRIVQAQYFKDPTNIATYLEKSLFLPFINNEKDHYRNSTFKKNMVSLEKLVLIRFSEEDMVVPAESSWFGYFNESLHVVEMTQQPIFQEDWIGLRALFNKGKIEFVTAKGKHMQFSDSFLVEIINDYLSPKPTNVHITAQQLLML